MATQKDETANMLRRVIDRLHKRMQEPHGKEYRLPVHPDHMSQSHAILRDHLAKLESGGDASVIDGEVVPEVKKIATD